MKLLGAAVVVLILSACDANTEPKTSGIDQKSLKISLSDDATEHTAATLSKYVHQLPRLCPGLNTFVDDLEAVRTENNGAVDGPAATVVIKVADRPKSFKLRELHAQGEHCFFTFVPGPSARLVLMKHACQSVCLGRQVQHSEQEKDFSLALVNY